MKKTTNRKNKKVNENMVEAEMNLVGKFVDVRDYIAGVNLENGEAEVNVAETLESETVAENPAVDEVVNAESSEGMADNEMQEAVNTGEAESMEVENAESKNVNVENAEVTPVETIEGDGSMETKDGEGKAEAVETVKKDRRKNGESSIYPIYKKDKDGQKVVYRWGFCMILNNATKEQREKFGNKLRYLEVHKRVMIYALKRWQRQ